MKPPIKLRPCVPTACLVPPRTKVDDLGCVAETSCNMNPGVFRDGSCMRSHLRGFVNGALTYGEDCYQGWRIPPDVDARGPLTFPMPRPCIDECGCGFPISLTGCCKINDNFDFPQFDNTSLVLLYLDGPPYTSKLTTTMGTTTAAPNVVSNDFGGHAVVAP